jgi:hypothetical protein
MARTGTRTTTAASRRTEIYEHPAVSGICTKFSSIAVCACMRMILSHVGW